MNGRPTTLRSQGHVRQISLWVFHRMNAQVLPLVTHKVDGPQSGGSRFSGSLVGYVVFGVGGYRKAGGNMLW